MVDSSILWVPITIGAAVSLLARNALQSGLTAEIGTLGATMVRFVYAVPWVVLFHAIGMALTHGRWPDFTLAFIGPVAGGAFSQIGGTALMLRAMDMRGFAVANAYIKMEPVLLALGGWWLLGDILSVQAWGGIVLATVGVLLAAAPAGESGVAVVKEIQSVTVLRGDSLWRISRRVLGKGIRYTQIYEAITTQIRDPNRIWPGQVLVAPGKPD